MSDALRPSADAALTAWAARVRANREQVEQYRETSPTDFYAPVARLFRAEALQRSEPTLDVLRGFIGPDDVLLDIGAGGGRYALPLALECREVIALDPSEGMLGVLRAGIEEHQIGNVRVVPGRWPAAAPDVGVADVALISHLGYDVEDIGPFLDAMEAVARRTCIAVLLERPPPTEADRLWPLVHGVTRAALPALPEFLTLLLARGRLFEVRLVERAPNTYSEPTEGLSWLRQQLWTTPDSPKDRALQAALTERQVRDADGRYALSFDPVRVGIVTWNS
jgi:hypothetical protein